MRPIWQKEEASSVSSRQHNMSFTGGQHQKSLRSSRSVPSRLFNRFEVRKHVFDLYNDYMREKEQKEEEPCCEDIDDMKLFDKAPTKAQKKTITAQQRANRERKAAEDQKFRTMQHRVRQENLQSLEQRHMQEMYDNRQKRIKSQ